MNANRNHLSAAARLVAALLVTAWGLTGSAQAANLKVPQQYPTIHAAVAAAQPGDRIVLANGTHFADDGTGTIVLDKSLTIRSASNDPTKCIVDFTDSATSEYFNFGFFVGNFWGVGTVLPNTIDVSISGIGFRNGYVGAILVEEQKLTVTDCAFSDLGVKGGYPTSYGAIAAIRSDVSVNRCRFENNSVGGRYPYSGIDTLSGCVVAVGGSCRITASTFIGNEERYGMRLTGTAVCTFGTLAEISNCEFIDNRAESPGPMTDAAVTVFGSGKINGCLFRNNAGWVGGAIYARSTGVDSLGVQISGCYFEANTAWQGGAISGNAVIADSTFSNNVAASPYSGAGGSGGALALGGYGKAMNCTFTGNAADYGSAVSLGIAVLQNCTFAGNGATLTGAVYSEALTHWDTNTYPQPVIANCAFWGNQGLSISRKADYTDGTHSYEYWDPLVQNCLLESANPLFVDPANGDFRLQLGSPCIDAGNASLLPPDIFDLDKDGNTTEPWPYDMDGNVRVWSPVGGPQLLDIGAYEYVQNTDVGLAVTALAAGDATLTFDAVTTAGNTTVQTLIGVPPVLPANFAVQGATYYEIQTTATYSGSIQVRLPYTGLTNPRILHFENGAWVDVTTSVDAQYVYGTVTSLSPFAVAETRGYPVEIDIKPASTVNSINLGSNGVIPVVIYSSETFDATTIDPASVLLADSGIKVRGNGTYQYSLTDVDGDGLRDMVVQISTVGIQLSQGDTEAVLTAMTRPTTEHPQGVQIIGIDTVRIVP
ncbi:MAG: hypothetical protein HZC36_10300 [Armatimonadetes bacterium]|nr:hypothetical protein [Armatimonadota bacterium]